MATTEGNYNPKTLNADRKNVSENGETDTKRSITDVITSMKNTKYDEKLEVIAGELVYIGNSEKESNWLDGVIESKNFKISLVTIPDKNKISGTVTLAGLLVDEKKISYYRIYLSQTKGTYPETPNIEILDKKKEVEFEIDNLITNTEYYIKVEVKMSNEGDVRVLESEKIITKPDIIKPNTPQITVPKYSNKYAITPITITLTDDEGGSGISKTQSKYIIDKTATSYNEENSMWQSANSFLEDEFTGDTATVKVNVKEDGEYYVHVLAEDGAGNKKSGISGKIIVDTVIPNEAVITIPTTTTTNSVDAIVTLTDNLNGSGIDITKSKYIYSTESNPYGDTEDIWNSATAFTNDIQTITVTSSTNEIYYLHVLILDNAGNRREVLSSGVTTNTETPVAPVITGTAATNVWINQNVTLTINEVTSPGITKYEYTINGGTWQTYNATDKIVITDEGLTIIRARAVNNVGTIGAESAGYMVKIDRTQPSTPVANFNGYTPGTWTNGNITLNLSSTDATSGISKYQWSTNGVSWNDFQSTWIYNYDTVQSPSFRAIDGAGNASNATSYYSIYRDGTAPIYSSYEIKNITNTGYDVYVYGVSDVSSGVNRVQFPTWTDNNGQDDLKWESGQNIGNGTWYYRVNASAHNNESGQYQTHIYIYDNVENYNVIVTNGVFIQGDYVASKGVNKPKLAQGLTPIKWDANGNVVNTNENDNDWYDYGSKKYANAIASNGSMWVWIPRYEYKISTLFTSTAQTIDVNFVANTQTQVSSGYTMHPAFTFGSTQLTGFWVAKFEGFDRPGQSHSSWGENVTLSYIFDECLNLKNVLNIIGANGNSVDSHLIKNIEWGAVTYLARSKYGWEYKVGHNSTYIAGGENYLSNTTQSTTGTIYGIYDMNGGAYEYVAAYANSSRAISSYNARSLINADNKYKDVYDVVYNSYGGFSTPINKIGDAIYEISDERGYMWQTEFPSSLPSNYTGDFIMRGGNYYDSRTSIFYYQTTVDQSNGIFFRSVILVGNGV